MNADTTYYWQAMNEQGYTDFLALPPHEQHNILDRAQEIKRDAEKTDSNEKRSK